MTRASVTSKGQVTIPKEIREQAHITMGTELDFHFENGLLTAKPINKSLSSLKGIVQTRRTTAVSLKEMKEAIRKGSKKSIS